jgi:predicted GTPase
MIEKVIIMGAAGRDFHNFNVYFRDNPRYRVIAFTAAQIPSIEGRLYIHRSFRVSITRRAFLSFPRISSPVSSGITGRI